MDYSYLKAFHIIAVVAWMATLMYLPRLFVYHMENINNKDFTDIVEVQESKLFNFIGIPACVCAIVSGGFIIFQVPAFMHGTGWVHAKVLLVLFLFVYFIHNGLMISQLKKGVCNKSSKYFRIYNEVPFILFIAITILVVLKPF